MRELYKSLMVGLLLIATLYSSVVFLSYGNNRISAQVVGVPGTCKSSFTLEVPSSTDIAVGGFGEITAKLKNIKCGLTNVKLTLPDITNDYYVVSPSYIQNIAPSKEGIFTINFDIPLDAEIRTYSSVYKITANEGTYLVSSLDLNIYELEKPKASVQKEIVTVNVEPATTALHGKKLLWFTLGVVTTIFAILIILFERFSFSTEPKKLPWKYTSRKELRDVFEGKKTRKRK